MESPPAPLIILLIGLGLIAGSFLGTLAVRLPARRPVLFARSVCDSCNHSLAPWQLVPVMSWLIQRGACRTCGRRISWFYPTIEIAAAGIALWASFYVSGIALVLSLVLGWLLLALMAMDILTFRLSDVLTIPLVAIGLFAGWLLEPSHFLGHVIGALVGWGGLALVAMFYQLLRHRPGLGQGDAKLLAAGGAWVGWQGLTSVLLIATVAALLVVLVLRLIGRRVGADTKLAFGAFLSLAIWIVWLYGPILT